jgi:hypothetical protein
MTETILRMLHLALVTLWQANPLYRHRARMAVRDKLLEAERMRADILAVDLADAERERDRYRESNMRNVLEATRLAIELRQARTYCALLMAEHQPAVITVPQEAVEWRGN